MSSYCQKLKNFIIFLISLGVLGSLSCGSYLSRGSSVNKGKYFKYAAKDIKFELGDENEFDFTVIDFSTDGKGRLIAHYRKKTRANGKSLGDFVRLSEDSGDTFGEEYEVAKLTTEGSSLTGHKFYFVGGGFAFTAVKEKWAYYSQAKDNLGNWSAPVRISDEVGVTHAPWVTLLSSSESDRYCVWVDDRRGVDLLFFSSSKDGGITWGVNQPIEIDFRNGMQRFPNIVLGENGRLLVFWEDGRDRKTLVDVRYSYSDDKGETWAKSQKINDDNKAVWQIDPTVVVRGSDIYTAFADFREKGDGDDNDWNIYFAHSSDNGTTWERNTRLNDVKIGRDQNPSLSIDKDGTLYCLWRSTRTTLFGQMVFSYSTDQGKNWSPSVSLTSAKEMVEEATSSHYLISQDRHVFLWGKDGHRGSEVVYSGIGKSDETISSDSHENPLEELKPIRFSMGEELFGDDFSGINAKNWEIAEGLWDIVDGTFVGVNTDTKLPFISFARFGEPQQYVLKGRFKLDPVSHLTANLYFRADKSGLKRYVISNLFRHGAWLSIKDDDHPNSSSLVGGIPLVQKRFSFRQNRWYQFTLVVSSEQFDYYVDDNLMLSYKGKMALPKGKIGIGGVRNSPTHFDDISISELK